MPVFRRDNSGRDVVTQNFFDDLRHLCAGFAGADNDNSPVNRNALSSNPKHSVFQRDEFSYARGRICCIQRSFPDHPRRMTQFVTIHFIDGCALSRLRSLPLTLLMVTRYCLSEDCMPLLTLS